MTSILFMGFLTFVAFAIILHKIGITKIASLGWKGDLLISSVMAVIFVGTFSGMAVGITAGIFLSIYLTFFKPKKTSEK
ncbi:hypothetical protein vBAmePPT11V19_00057 [Alteromonas phage vB_AmeP_PT11-V19]|nr:hypothetical protein vBAmePPT11V19_00057 [Alteromonas phage vB_AmeP_PT11-V19]